MASSNTLSDPRHRLNNERAIRHGPRYLNNIDSAYVEDGTECGIEKYCFGKTCSSATSKIVSQCPKGPQNAGGMDSICFNRGICTNIGICLCHPGWSGHNCSITANESIAVVGLGYSEQIKNYIWAYLKEIGMYNGLLYKDAHISNTQNRENRRPLTTMHLILILGSVVVTVFILLSIFMVCCRRIDLHTSKKSEGYCCSGMIDSTPNNQDKDTASYRSCITEEIIGSSSRKYDLMFETTSINEGKYRTRRYKRRFSNGSINRQISRENKDGDESTSIASVHGCNDSGWNKTRPGSAHSDSNLNHSCRVGRTGVDLRNIVEKNIKFGVIPPYKDQKLIRSVNNSPSINTPNPSLVTSLVDPAMANNCSPMCNESHSLHRSTCHTYHTNQLNNGLLSSMHPLLPTSPPLGITKDHKEPLLLSNKIFSTPFGLPAPALFPNTPYNSTPAVSVPSTNIGHDKIMDITFKQPERGILKNKSSGDLNESLQTAKLDKTSHSCSKKERPKQHNCGTTTNDSNSTNSPNSGSQSSLSSGDTNSSSCTSSTSSSSSVSSTNSSQVARSNSAKNDHSQKSNDRRTQNIPLPAPPTILCNAGNQTDDIPSDMTSSRTGKEFKLQKQMSNNIGDGMEECTDINCDRCRVAAAEEYYKSPSETMLTSYSSAYDIVDIIDDVCYHNNHTNPMLNSVSDTGHQRTLVPCQYTQPYNSLNTYPYYYLSSSDQTNDYNRSQDNDDINYQFSISAYCRGPRQDGGQMALSNPGHLESDCHDIASNDGTIEGSDTSSIPEAHCDLVNLAHLEIGSSRPNPMLTNLLLGQSTGKKRYNLDEFSQGEVFKDSLWSPSCNDSCSPGRLPHPNSYMAGNNYPA